MAKQKITKPEDGEISKDFEKIFREDLDAARTVLELTWFRNILYYLGEQWLGWFESTGTFGRYYELNSNEPTPVSNIIRDHIRSMKALILNKSYSTRAWPNSMEQKDKDAAKLSEQVLRWLDSLGNRKIDDIKEWVVLWMVSTGNGFARAWANTDTGVYILDKDGKVIPSKGEVAAECIIPFNTVVAPLGLYLEEKAYAGIKSLKEREWVEDTFNVKIETDTDVKDVDYQRQLMSLVANVSPWKGRGLQTVVHAAEDFRNRDFVVMKELEFRPTKKFPKGRYQAIAGDKVVINETEMPINVDKEGQWNYTCCGIFIKCT